MSPAPSLAPPSGVFMKAGSNTALADEVRALQRAKNDLQGELGALQQKSTTLAAREQNFARLIHGNKRFFERALIREISRSARETNGRFTVVILQVTTPMPPWFIPFLQQAMRTSDLLVRAGPSEFWLYLHAAGVLGCRVFQSRIGHTLAAACTLHRTSVRLNLGSANYPQNASTEVLLLQHARDTLAPMTHTLTPIFAPSIPPSRGFQLAPPSRAHLPTRESRCLIKKALRDAAAREVSGEVVVRAGDVVGRVYFCAGRVAWAHCSAHRRSLTYFLRAAHNTDDQDIKFAYNEARRRRGNFAETLIELGCVSRAQMRAVLFRHLREHLRAVLALAQPEVSLLPQSRRYNSALLFSVDELLDSD